MTKRVTRREFLAASAPAGAAMSAAGRSNAAPAPFKTKLHKALIMGRINEKNLATMKEAGFEGVECSAANVKPAEAEKFRIQTLSDNVTDGRSFYVGLRAEVDANDRPMPFMSSEIVSTDVYTGSLKRFRNQWNPSRTRGRRINTGIYGTVHTPQDRLTLREYTAWVAELDKGDRSR